MKKIITVVFSVILLSGCDVLSKLPQTPGLGGITEAEAGQGIKEALSQGLSGAVLRLNKQDGFFKDELYKFCFRPMRRK
jgi:hypothetical protein